MAKGMRHAKDVMIGIGLVVSFLVLLLMVDQFFDMMGEWAFENDEERMEKMKECYVDNGCTLDSTEYGEFIKYRDEHDGEHDG